MLREMKGLIVRPVATFLWIWAGWALGNAVLWFLGFDQTLEI